MNTQNETTVNGQTMDAVMAAILRMATENGQPGQQFLDVTRKDGEEIQLPHGIKSYDEGLKWLTRKKEADEKTVRLSERIEGFPLDVLNSLFLAIKQKYGFHEAKGREGFFGPTPPSFITIPTDAQGGQVTLLTGQFELPGIEGKFSTSPDDSSALMLNGVVKQKHVKEVKELVTLTREMLRTSSLYQGKAIRIDTNETVMEMVQPTFININVGHEQIFLNKSVMRQVEATVWNRIMATEAGLAVGAPLKGGSLFEGNFGTGKTLAMAHTARIAVENGWGFVYCPRPEDLIYVYNVARQLQVPGKGVVVAVEDLDRLKGKDDYVKALSLVLDGVDTKDGKIILVATSNYPEDIPAILLRSGRIGHTIHFAEPDDPTIKALVEYYAQDIQGKRSLLAKDLNWPVVVNALRAMIPATIREVVETAKWAAITRPSPLTLTTDDLVAMATQMRRHIELCKPPKAEPSTGERLVADLSQVVRMAMGNGGDHSLDEVYSLVDSVDDKVISAKSTLDNMEPVDNSDQLDNIERLVTKIEDRV